MNNIEKYEKKTRKSLSLCFYVFSANQSKMLNREREIMNFITNLYSAYVYLFRNDRIESCFNSSPSKSCVNNNSHFPP